MNNRKNLLRLLLFVSLSFVAVILNGQTVSKTFKNEALKTVLKEVEKQTGLSVIYKTDEVNENKKITATFKNTPINTVLDKILDEGLIYKLQNKMIVISKSNQQKQSKSGEKKKISGTVVDENGTPIIGASVQIKGEAQGTITDFEGKFTLADVPNDKIISISYISYQTVELRAGDGQVAHVVMKEDNAMLDEVVVIGYGTVKKRDLTGSVSSVNAAKIASVPAVSAIETLQGRAPGVIISNTNWSPGSEPSIFIRGKRSITASNGPLYVVDGIPMTGGISEISPADIESMEVLKDASATAIYGSRGANGVILITTKQGKEGKTKIDYNGYVGFQTIQNKLDLMDAAEYAEYTREAYRNSTGKNQYLSDTPNKEQDMLLPMFSQDAYVLESVMMGYDENGNYDPSKVRSNDWFDAVTRNGLLTEHQLNIRGGGQKTNFMASATYSKVDGLVKDQSYERYSARLNLNHKINKYIKIGAQTQYSYSVKQRGSNMIADNYMYRITPLGSLYEADGTLTQKIGGDELMYNPLYNLVDGAVDRPVKTNRFLGSYFLEVTFPVKGLTFRSNLGIDSRTKQDYEFYSAETTERQFGSSYAKNSVSKYSMVTWENYVTYQRDFGKKHSLGLTLLQSIQQDVTESNTASTEGLAADILKYYDLAAGNIVDGIGSGYTKWNMASFMGRLNYNYLGRYLLTVSARYDGSSRLADGHKWVVFPSAALAWRISDESFARGLTWLDNLKLRTGYGKTGNSSVDPYQTRGTLSKAYYVFNNGKDEMLGYAPKGMANKLLTWETTEQWNLGLDFGFLKNRINGSIDLYLQNTSDLLLNRQLPVVSGFSNIISNIGRTRNKGIEVSLNTRNIISKNFDWSTDWTFTSSREEIVELYNGKTDDPGSGWFIGEPIDVYYNYKKIGIWQDTPEDWVEMEKFNANGSNFKPGTIRLWDNGDYKITEEDKMILGTKRPKFVASLVNTFRYKDFDFSLFLYGSYGGLLKNDISVMEKPGRANSVKLDYWTPTNPTNKYPRPSVDMERPDYISTTYYEKADFIRVRNMTLGYTLPKSLTSKWSVERLRVYVTANNPFIITNFSGIDPEGATGNTSPSYSSWMFGLNISL